jgi:hypothetical protein
MTQPAKPGSGAAYDQRYYAEDSHPDGTVIVVH